MAKKTATETAPTDDDLTRLAGMVADQIELDSSRKRERVDSLLLEVASQDRDLTFDEMSELRRFMGWSSEEVQKEFNRIRQVNRWQRVAGSTADREQLAARAAEAERTLQERGAVIQQEIEQRQRELKELQGAAKQLTQRQADVQAALNTLASDSLLPIEVVARMNHAKRDASKAFKKELGEIEGELRFRDQVSKGPTESYSPEVWVIHLQSVGDHVVARATDGHGRPTWKTTDRWEAIKQQWAEEKPKMEARLAELRQALASADADREALRQRYWR